MSSLLETLYILSDSLSQSPLGAPPSSKSNYRYLSTFLSDLTPLCTTHPILFAPHLQNLLSFLPPIILPSVDCGPTPTVGRPFPNAGNRQGEFIFPPPVSTPLQDASDETDERSALRLSALEFMISLTEARPNMIKKVSGWTEITVRACLEGMGEFDEDDSLDAWLREDVSKQIALFISSCNFICLAIIKFQLYRDRLDACAIRTSNWSSCMRDGWEIGSSTRISGKDHLFTWLLLWHFSVSSTSSL